MAYTDLLAELLGGGGLARSTPLAGVFGGSDLGSGPALATAFRGGSDLGGGSALASLFRGGGGEGGPSDALTALNASALASSIAQRARRARQQEDTAKQQAQGQQVAARAGQARQATAGGGLPGVQLTGLGPGQKDEFYRRAMAVGQRIEQESGIPAEAFAAVAANESNFGNTPGNVLFGVKAGPGEPGVDLQTWEMVNGVRTPMSQRFRSYPTAYDAAQHFVGLMQNERYGPALNAFRAGQVDAPGFVRMVNQAGYATNPNWHQEIATRMAEAAPYRNDPGTQALLAPPAVAPALAQGVNAGGPPPGAQGRSATAQQVLAQADQWVAANPRYEMSGGATNRQVADCSGFIVGVMQELNMPFPAQRGGRATRTAEDIRQVSTPVAPGQAQPGDLIFFHSTYGNMGPNVASHVGIVTENGVMLHTGGGAPLGYASFQNSQWQSKLLDVRRPPQYGGP